MKQFRFLLSVVFFIFLAGINLSAQDGEARVYFLGIGIENCSGGTPGKPNAVDDVNLVLNRTKSDANGGSVNFTFSENGEPASMMVSKAVTYTLFNDNATLDNIDSIVSKVMAPLMRPQDVFYLYISASSTGADGDFNIPSKPIPPGKKGKLTPPTRNVLESSHIRELCSIIPCQNQLLVADANSWFEFQAALVKEVILPVESQRNQIILAPWADETDSVLVEGKYYGFFAASIKTAKEPVLRLLNRNASITNRVKTSLNNAYNKLTENDNPAVEIYESYTKWQNVAGVGSPPKTTGAVTTTTGEQDRGVQTDDDEDLSKVKVDIASTKNFALIIANEHYEDPDWPTLNNAIDDALAVKTELETFYNYEVVLDTNVTKQKLLSDLLMLHSKNFSANTQVLFYYAGHGGHKTLGQFAGTGYMVPVDGKSELADPTMDSYVSYDILLSRLNTLPAQHVLALVDACFAGSADENVFAEGQTSPFSQEPEIQRAGISEQMCESMKRKTRYFIGSGKLNSVSDGSKGKLSPFATLVTEKLKTSRSGKPDQQSIVYASEIESLLYKAPNMHPWAFAFGGTTSSACGFMFVPRDLQPHK